MLALAVVLGAMVAIWAAIMGLAWYAIRKQEAEKHEPSSEGLLNGNYKPQ